MKHSAVCLQFLHAESMSTTQGIKMSHWDQSYYYLIVAYIMYQPFFFGSFISDTGIHAIWQSEPWGFHKMYILRDTCEKDTIGLITNPETHMNTSMALSLTANINKNLNYKASHLIKTSLFISTVPNPYSSLLARRELLQKLFRKSINGPINFNIHL